MLKTTSRNLKQITTTSKSWPIRVLAACDSWPNLQHVATHISGPKPNSISTTTTIVVRNMSIYDYLRQHLSAKRQRCTYEPHETPRNFPAPKLRKHNFSSYQKEREREKQREKEHERKSKGTGSNSSMEDYDIRFFFYLNSLILFTMSCRQYEGDDLKHFICDRIRKFDRLRRKARKRRKRRHKQAELSVS